MSFFKNIFTSKLNYIRDYTFPPECVNKLKINYNLNEQQAKQVQGALKDFFKVFSQENKKIAMPSFIVDQLWHYFLEHKEYSVFCKKAFGKNLNHKPNENKIIQPKEVKVFNQDILNVYNGLMNLAKKEAIIVSGGFPFLFVADSVLKIENGFYYDAQILNHLKNQALKSSVLLKNDNNTNSFSSSSSCSAISTYHYGETQKSFLPFSNNTSENTNNDTNSNSSSCSSCSSCGGGGD